jgi:DNA-binding XRE family transcriptional regulator
MDLTEINAKWGQRIKRLRKTGDLTAAAIASAAGITPQYLHAIERGQYSPSDEVKLRIAKAMGVEVGEIFSYDLEDAS